MEPSKADRETECEVFVSVGCTLVVLPTCNNTGARNGSLSYVSGESRREAWPGKSLELLVW